MNTIKLKEEKVSKTLRFPSSAQYWGAWAANS